MSFPIALALIIMNSELPGAMMLESSADVERDPEWLTYCSGVPSWVCWTGTYRGTWFDLQDFYPGIEEAELYGVEFWFYEDSQHPWDVSDFYAEIWSGDQNGPECKIAEELALASHMVPVRVFFAPPLEVAADFWVLQNPEFSAGGWPSIISDDTALLSPHSFYSNGLSWIPWMEGRNYFISVLVEESSLNNSSWGALKTIF